MKLPEFFGLDIGNYAIRAVQVKYTSFGKPDIVAMGQVQMAGTPLNLKDVGQRYEVIKKIIAAQESAEIKTKKVVAALPDSMIFSKIISVPDLAEDKVEQMLFYELKNHIPVNPSDVQTDYIILGADPVKPKFIRILLIAAPKSLVELYANVLQEAHLEPLALETETVAVSRIMGHVLPMKEPILVADFGHKGVDMCLLKNHKIMFSQSIGTGSDALSQTLARDYHIPVQQAEQYKMKIGLLADQADGKVMRALVPIMNLIVNEINKLISYIKFNFPEDVPKQIFFVGDGAKLPGLVEYLKTAISLPCVKIDPVSQIPMDGKYKKEFSQLTTIGFTLATGLAMKEE